MIEKLGNIQGLDIYYDRYQENKNFLIGFRASKLKFVIGNTKDLKIFEKAINIYKKYYEKIKFEDL